MKALDVTQQFTDLTARLVVAKDTRERLLVLLEKTTHPEERRRILQEVKRLTEQIESMSPTLATLQNLVDFYTITLELEPVLDNAGAQTSRSPFSWVRSLAPHLQTIGEGRDEIEMTLPDGFVLFVGTMFAPTKDRDQPGEGFTHKVGDVVSIHSAGLGTLVNRVNRSDRVAPWDFGTLALMRNLRQRGLS